jgi:hypothetical protein
MSRPAAGPSIATVAVAVLAVAGPVLSACGRTGPDPTPSLDIGNPSPGSPPSRDPTPQEPVATGATSGGATGPALDVTDPAVVASTYADDYLRMLSDLGDRSLRRSVVASPTGLAFMEREAERSATDEIAISGRWRVEIEDVEERGDLALSQGCIDVRELVGTRGGTPEPFPGDRIAFSVELVGRGETWQANAVTISGEACPAR